MLFTYLSRLGNIFSSMFMILSKLDILAAVDGADGCAWRGTCATPDTGADGCAWRGTCAAPDDSAYGCTWRGTCATPDSCARRGTCATPDAGRTAALIAGPLALDIPKILCSCNNQSHYWCP